uniref:Transmembrane p24 trafficking protein 3 n=1 Tax=Bubo bubo TaxID=30461 RepID=A0A8C0EBF3_BUBBB
RSTRRPRSSTTASRTVRAAPSGAPAMSFGWCHLRHHAQVITGGHYDVDCYVEDPNGRTIYKETKKQYDSFPHRAEVEGIYTFCFSNEFSTFSHKTIYFDFQVGDEPPILPDM